MNTKDSILFRMPTTEEVKVSAAHNPEEGKVYLYLYLDARTVMDILDDAVGPMNWDRKHEMLGNKVYCAIGINVNYESVDRPRIMVWKSDVGTKTPIEKEKGESSDSFKRAAVSWGIARALYSAPDMILDQSACMLDRDKVLNKYEVSSISYSENGRKIKDLIIIDQITGEIVYEMEDYQEVMQVVRQTSNSGGITGTYTGHRSGAFFQTGSQPMPASYQAPEMSADQIAVEPKSQYQIEQGGAYCQQMERHSTYQPQTIIDGNAQPVHVMESQKYQSEEISVDASATFMKAPEPISEEAQKKKDADIEERKVKIKQILDEKIGYTARKDLTFRQVWKDSRYMDFMLQKFTPTDSQTQAVKDKVIYLLANKKIVDMVI